MRPTLNLDRNIFMSFANNWKYFLAWGIILILLGCVALYFAVATTLISVMVLGLLLLTAGIVVIIDAFQYWLHKWGGFFLQLLMGLLYSGAGLFLFFTPAQGAVSLTFFIGAILIAIGFIRIFYAIFIRFAQWEWSLVSGILALILGTLILSELPQSGLFMMGIFIGIDLLFIGWTYVIVSLTAKSIAKSTK